jgi:hypothetical protein
METASELYLADTIRVVGKEVNLVDWTDLRLNLVS